MGTTVERIVRLNPVANDLATAMITFRRKLVNRTFEAVERMGDSLGHDLKCTIIVVAANLAGCHWDLYG